MNPFSLLSMMLLAVAPAAAGIHAAAEKGDLESVRALVAADPRAVNDTVWAMARTPLHVAIRGRQVEVARYLIEHGADVSARDRDGVSVLSTAALFGLADVATALMDRGADVGEDVDHRGQGPLQMAASRGHAEVISLLVARGAPVDGRHPEGVTPLDWAAFRGHLAAAQVLLDAGADPNAPSRVDWAPTPMLGALCGAGCEMVQLLLDHGGDPNAATPQGVSALRLAIERGDSSVVELLLARRPDLSRRDSVGGMTPLHRAAANGLPGVCRRLLDLGADANARDRAGRTPLDLARRHGHSAVAELLRARGGVAMSGEAAFGRSPLLRRALRPGEAVVWYLGHSGWAVKTRSRLLVFDCCWYGAEPAEPSLANGRIAPAEIAGLDVVVFASHAHWDHFDRRILDWPKSGGRFTHVFGWQVEGDSGHVCLPDTLETWRDGGLVVRKINSCAEPGGAFLVEVDGLTLYHGGDYLEDAGNAWLLDSLAARGPRPDIVFVEPGFREVAYSTIRKLGPKVVYPMHARMNEPGLEPFAAEARQRFPGTRFVCPQSRGDRWIYSKGRVR